MKLPRPVAAAIGVAVVAVSGLAIAAPASAATNVTFVTASEFGTFGPSSSEPGSWNELAGSTLVSGTTGLASSSNGEITYTLPTPVVVSGTSLIDTTVDTYFYTDDNASTLSMIYLETPLGGQFRFQANASGDRFADTNVQWTSNASINGITVGTLTQLAAAIEADPAYIGSTITVFDVFMNLSGTFYTITVDGAGFSFMPLPVVTGAPAQITQDALATTGYPVTASGFLPNESVDVYVYSPAFAGPFATVTADGNGVVSYNWIAPAPTPAVSSDYAVTFVGDDTGVVQFFAFAVIAGLAATGTETTVPLIAGGVLLLGGVALAVVGSKRRKRV